MIRTLKHLLKGHFRIATQLYLGIGGAVAITMVASLVGWFSFDRVGDIQNRVNEGSVPEMAAAFGVARQSGTLVAAAPRLTSAATVDDFDRVKADIAEERKAFETQLAALIRRDIRQEDEERYKRTHAYAAELTSNIEAIEREVAALFEVSARSEALRAELSDLRGKLSGMLIPAIDDQLFYAMTGYRTIGQPPAPRERHFSSDEFDRYRHLADLKADATIATQLLASSFNLSDALLLEPLRERFEAAAGRIERSLSALGTSPWRDQIAPHLNRLFELGLGEQGGFDLIVREFALAQRQRNLLQNNLNLEMELGTEVEGLVSAARERTQEATRASTQAIGTGRSVLLGLNVVSITGAVLIAWLFVGRVLLRRLERLSDRMRGMADGDLEAKVDISGNDEVADMATALEVFRRHALEVQRLNLVEKLAEELREKNEQLETVLADLRRAQDQIVMRDKLAALGELTAGVAHEIKNPLNFVKNFSEVSAELLEELQEELQEMLSGETGDLDEEKREFIQEICQDLTDNLERISEHGERANRIVQDMLSMGRGSAQSQPTNINNLLDEHARLAYHSARASDPDFQLDIKQDLDPSVGDVEVVPQDMGRVFLNMVSNACHATDEKRRENVQSDYNKAPYMPTLWLTTRRGQERLEVRIKDNGNGIPPNVVDKIFNPFFTTKPTDQGTGLGLALSNDIVREHGGSIRVETEPGEFTEMVVEIPLEAPALVAEETTDEDSP